MAPRSPLHSIPPKGLEAGKTKIKYKEVEIGTVQSITLSEDRSLVLVTVRIEEGSQKFYR